MNSINKTLLVLLSAGLITGSCKKKDVPLTVPVLTTTAVTSITALTATSGGTISTDGGASITATGVCWSKTNQTPTVTDDKIEGNALSGSFTANLANLTSNSIYYVRAYASSSVGTGYGNVITFTTGNAGPTAVNLSITGDAKVNSTLTANYTYVDSEGDAENGTSFKWYVANDATGSGEVVIDGATVKTYVVQNAQQGKYIRFSVIPKTTSGTTTGLEVKSPFIGAVGEATTVTFTYHGNQVTYGIITSPVTNRKWLDRNLGAASTPISVSDYLNYGDFFQWGRRIDGHQTITRNGNSDANVSGVGVTFNLSATDNPGDNLYIAASEPPFDWRNPKNDNLWQGANGINNPCPSGWRIPTKAEWQAEMIDNLDKAFTNLKLTYTGYRLNDGVFYGIDLAGYYWSSSTGTADPTTSVYTVIRSTRISYNEYNRSMANACRCIKN